MTDGSPSPANPSAPPPILLQCAGTGEANGLVLHMFGCVIFGVGVNGFSLGAGLHNHRRIVAIRFSNMVSGNDNVLAR